ncbi:glyoxalase superfamily protein [Chelativorans sp. M5D2P16]|uniref:glyoxalase superfamily protein n=1 Tax=Chelativorans sp. M5D2P16 TaxID=3095678 RepID=UPI002ACAF935|nr:glyoxalase superfamily protein [Chelativorans sp. M5D2P16]MDZ5695964.1 glyoxalase superfamily protein [Chelativorans sp. M5D2P16]
MFRNPPIGSGQLPSPGCHSEHAGDATPGGNMCVYMKGIRELHRELTAKEYRYMKPGLEDAGTRLELQVIDPFNNRIRFMELKDG